MSKGVNRKRVLHIMDNIISSKPIGKLNFIIKGAL